MIESPYDRAHRLIEKMRLAHQRGDDEGFDDALMDLRELHRSLENLENDGK